VIVITGSYYSAEPPDEFSDDQLQAAAAAAADASDTIPPEVAAENNAEPDREERDADSKQPDADDKAVPKAEAGSGQPGDAKADQNQPESRGEDGAENTNNNAKSDYSDDDRNFASKKKRRSESSKYFVVPRPPTSQLVLVVYGDLGHTAVLPLTADNPRDVSFQPGHADEFQVSRWSHRYKCIWNALPSSVNFIPLNVFRNSIEKIDFSSFLIRL